MVCRYSMILTISSDVEVSELEEIMTQRQSRGMDYERKLGYDLMVYIERNLPRLPSHRLIVGGNTRS